MSQSLHVCKICGKKFATAKAVYGHKRIHSGKSNRSESPVNDNGLQRIWGLCSASAEISMESKTLDPLRTGYKSTFSLSLKESSSFMTEIEQHEMNEAAMSLLLFSERVAVIRNLPPDDIAMDLELNSTQEKIIHCAESKQEFSEVHTTCGDIAAQALPSPLRCISQTKRESNSSYKCKTCGKSFGRSQALGGHQTLHRSIKGLLAHKRKDFEGGNSLSVLTDSGAKKVVPQLSCFEVSQEELIELRDTNVMEHCVESKQNYSEVFPHSDFEMSGTCSDVVAQALPSPLISKFKKKAQSNSSYECKICGKSFWCSQALGGHKTLHRSIKVQLARKKEDFEDGKSLYDSSEAKKIVSQPSSFEDNQKELPEHQILM